MNGRAIFQGPPQRVPEIITEDWARETDILNDISGLLPRYDLIVGDTTLRWSYDAQRDEMDLGAAMAQISLAVNLREETFGGANSICIKFCCCIVSFER